MTSAGEMINLTRVWKSYRLGGEEVHALAGINIDIPLGSFWAVMGPSGSGKSTLLNILGCLDRPSRGDYHIRGANTRLLGDDALSEIRLRHLGFIFQSFHLIPQLSVRENIELPLYYLGWESRAAGRRAGELAELVGLGARLGHRPAELSGGQQQRVAVARALANDPAVILADEPTGNLDTATGMQIMDLLAFLNRRGKTVIMVTHEPDLAAYASHHLRMRDGRVEQAGE